MSKGNQKEIFTSLKSVFVLAYSQCAADFGRDK